MAEARLRYVLHESVVLAWAIAAHPLFTVAWRFADRLLEHEIQLLAAERLRLRAKDRLSRDLRGIRRSLAMDIVDAQVAELVDEGVLQFVPEDRLVDVAERVVRRYDLALYDALDATIAVANELPVLVADHALYDALREIGRAAPQLQVAWLPDVA